MQLVGYNKRMVDLKFIREYPEKVKRGSASKNVEIDVDKILQIDDKIKNSNGNVACRRKCRGIETVTDVRDENGKGGHDNEYHREWADEEACRGQRIE